jgi:hypothetical protein
MRFAREYGRGHHNATLAAVLLQQQLVLSRAAFVEIVAVAFSLLPAGLPAL